MKTQLPKLEGIKAHQSIQFFTNREAAFAYGEDMAEMNWVVEYKPDGNCIAVVTTSIEKEARNCATC
jgi:hypothetical protein